MSWIDWAVFVAFLVWVVFDGLKRTRDTKSLEDYYAGGRRIPWWAAGLSIMATQASAITVIGTTGQGHEHGMDFVQTYFGLPFAMVKPADAAKVAALADGVLEADVIGRTSFDMGQTALLEIGSIRVVVSEHVGIGGNHPVVYRRFEIEPAAAYDLATSVGRNLMLLDNELDKLIAYRGGAGPIRKTDVRLMVPYTQEASIFDMVDAIGQKNSAEATRLLRELERDGAAPLYLLAMIVRQFRILVQVTDLQDSGLDKYEIGTKIGLHHYPTGKAMQQSRRWRMDALLTAYDRLLETDLAIKTGKLPDDLALDLLVLELCNARV